MNQADSTPRTAGRGPCGLDAAELALVTEAIASAERRTSAEIRVAVASAPLVHPALYRILWAALASLILPWGIIAFASLRPVTVLATQAGCFILLSLLLTWKPLGSRLVPLAAKRGTARATALHLFHAHGIHQTMARNGLLIFVAPHDRLVELVADEGVQAAIPRDAWISLCGEVVEKAGRGALGEGLAAAVERAGELLGPHLPAHPHDQNELSDRVVIV
ncbi:TPM domain-containing protein [Xanthobacter sp. DSM 24535]|uniref:TPM domain-containing protein n=1 Tax=Roseixanthobacter psychrophilus TaxID=3119917 RepID=UPI0037285AB6